MKKILYLGILCTLLLSACNDDDKEEITPSRDMQMLVVNEGINGEGGSAVRRPRRRREHGERCCRLPGWRHSRPQQS